MGAARRGDISAPVDLRYLQKGIPKRGNDTSESSRARVVTYLRGVYDSVAETLPDVRDDTCEDVDPGAEYMAVELPQADPDPYADAINNQEMRMKLKPKGKGIRSKRLGLNLNTQRRPENGYEKRWLPPGHMRDYFEQFLLTEPDSQAGGKPVAFSTFWRVWVEEFGAVLQFRPTSSHALCSTCVRHKLLVRAFCGHLRARECQVAHYVAHLKAQYAERLAYWDLRSSARLTSSFHVVAICDGMDQAKFTYPRSDLFRSKELQGFQRPRAHISGAIIHGHAVFFFVSPAELRKDANSSIEMVAYILHLVSKEVDLRRVTFHLQSDNTSREIKNNHTIRFLASLVSHGLMALPSAIFELESGNILARHF